MIDDMFLWNTIKQVVPNIPDNKTKLIYEILHNKEYWTINDIERLATNESNN